MFSLDVVGVLNKVKSVPFSGINMPEMASEFFETGKSIFGKTGGWNDSGSQPNTLPINCHVYPAQQWNLWCSAVYVAKGESVFESGKHIILANTVPWNVSSASINTLP